MDVHEGPFGLVTQAAGSTSVHSHPRRSTRVGSQLGSPESAGQRYTVNAVCCGPLWAERLAGPVHGKSHAEVVVIEQSRSRGKLPLTPESSMWLQVTHFLSQAYGMLNTELTGTRETSIGCSRWRRPRHLRRSQVARHSGACLQY